MSYPNPRRLSFRDTAATLDFKNMGELQKYRVRCQREGVAFPVLGAGGFLESDVIAYKAALAARINTVPIPASQPPAQPTSPPSRDRRSGVDRRQK